MMNQEQIEELIDRSRQNDTIAFAQLVSEFSDDGVQTGFSFALQ